MSNKQKTSRRIVSGAALSAAFYCLLLLSACTAITRTHQVDRSSSGSTANPLSIPCEFRRAQFEKENLVVNHSFEDGRVLSGDPETPFILKGWDILGQNISWVDRKASTDDSNAVPDGTHCIKITRKTASEVSTADGIVSDYIPVIPGNYTFTYHIRLQNLVNNRYRLGVKLFDAIVIRVLFFDQNKLPVDARYINPVSGSPIDNSDKSYAFSNFWRIDDLPWSRVRGRSYNYPFSEGDIPDLARYVRLYFGLKGTGTAWLDNIYFGYSKWNFTAVERFTPLFDKPLTWEQRLLPTPKKINKIGDITYYEKSGSPSLLPVIVVPNHASHPERAAAKILQNKISHVLNNVNPNPNHDRLKARIVENDFYLQDNSGPRLVISIGKNKLYQQVQPALPLHLIRDKQQGYVIKAEKIGNCHVLFLMGETPIGSYYASTTAIQLFENERFVYHNAAIVDYPDFLDRPYVFKNWDNEDELNRDLNALERMSLYKLNKVYFGYNRNNKAWYRPDALYRKGLSKAGRKIKSDGVMSLAVMVNPYSHFDMEAPVESLDSQLRDRWTHASPESFNMLKDVYKIGLEAGANTIMLLADDFLPHIGSNRQHYSLYTLDDKKRFVNLQNAHAFLINNLRKWLDSDYPGTRIEFCPPWYSNEHIDRSQGRAEIYLEELSLQIPQDVAIIWTGPTIRSLSIDMADLNRYRSLIGRWPILWDNTLYARNLEVKRYGGYTTYYPGKVRLCNLFEPYDVIVPENFQNVNHHRQIYTNGNAYSEVFKIKYATVADYEWNTADYHPERSLWKILCTTYGQVCARELIFFSDAYYRLYGICSMMETQGVTDPRIRSGKNALADMNDYLSEIAKTLPGGQPLVAELEKKQKKQKDRFEKLIQNKNEPAATESSDNKNELIISDFGEGSDTHPKKPKHIGCVASYCDIGNGLVVQLDF